MSAVFFDGELRPTGPQGLIDARNVFGGIRVSKAPNNGTADATSTLQGELDDHKLVFLPPGTYRITNKLHSRHSGGGLIGSGWLTKLNADGDFGTIVEFGPTSAPEIEEGESLTWNQMLQFPVIRDLQIASAGNRTTGAAIYAHYCHGLKMHNLQIGGAMLQDNVEDTSGSPRWRSNPNLHDGIFIENSDQIEVWSTQILMKRLGIAERGRPFSGYLDGLPIGSMNSLYQNVWIFGDGGGPDSDNASSIGFVSENDMGGTNLNNFNVQATFGGIKMDGGQNTTYIFNRAAIDSCFGWGWDIGGNLDGNGQPIGASVIEANLMWASMFQHPAFERPAGSAFAMRMRVTNGGKLMGLHSHHGQWPSSEFALQVLGNPVMPIVGGDFTGTVSIPSGTKVRGCRGLADQG